MFILLQFHKGDHKKPRGHHNDRGSSFGETAFEKETALLSLDDAQGVTSLTLEQK